MGLTRREVLKVGVLAGGALLLPLERGVRAAATNRIATSRPPVVCAERVGPRAAGAVSR